MLADALRSLVPSSLPGSEFAQVGSEMPFFRIFIDIKECLIFVVTSENGNLVRMYAKTNLGLDGFRPTRTTPGYSMRVVKEQTDQEAIDLVSSFLDSLPVVSPA